MYVPRPDQPLSDDECWDLVRDQGFGQLIAPGSGRDLPVVAPTQYVVTRTDAPAEVLLHLATPNPIWTALTEKPRAMLSVAGDWAFIPSDWNAPPPDPTLGIPTTYYAAVQISADTEIVDDDDAKLEVLRTQLAVLQPDTPVADPSVQLGRLPGIRGLRLTVTEVRGKFKYGGNRDSAHRQSVAKRLGGRGSVSDLAAREHVLRRDLP